MSHICPFKATPRTQDRECSREGCQLWVSSSHDGESHSPHEMCAFQGIFHAMTATLYEIKKIKKRLPRRGDNDD